MAQSGYINGKPDASFWMSEVRRGILFRKKFANQDKWNTWRSYYRGIWPVNTLAVNLFFRMMRTTVPRIYFRNPSITITNTRPGPEFAAFAQLIERVDNKLIRTMKVKNSVKSIIQHTWMFGTGAGVIGIGGKGSFTPDELDNSLPTVDAGSKLTMRTEYGDTMKDDMPWFLPAHPSTFIVPAGLDKFGNGRWFAQWIRRPLFDVQKDPRLIGTKDLKPSKSPDSGIVTSNNLMDTPVDMIDLVVVRDKMFRKVFVLAPYGGGNKVLFFADDDLQINGRAGAYPLVFNEDDEVFWGVSDSIILDPQQKEMNEIRTLQAKHRRLSIVKLFVEAGSMEVDEIEKMTDEEVLSVIRVKDVNQIKPMTIAEEPASLRYAGAEVASDVRDNLGFSRNQSGNFAEGSGGGASRASATEAQIVQAASEIRIDERRDMVADMISDMFTDVNTVLFETWKEEQVVSVMGTDGLPLWVKFTPEALKGVEYMMDIDPDSAAPTTAAMRTQKAVQTFGLLKDNPLIDPQKLTQMLLRELHGVDFDNMMKDMGQMREGSGGNPNQPMSMEQYVQHQAQAAPPNGGKRPA
jgi:hypothetical protein